MALMQPLLPTMAADPVPHSDREARLARESSQAIAGFIHGDAILNVTFTRELEATIPASAVKLLARSSATWPEERPYRPTRRN